MKRRHFLSTACGASLGVGLTRHIGFAQDAPGVDRPVAGRTATVIRYKRKREDSEFRTFQGRTRKDLPGWNVAGETELEPIPLDEYGGRADIDADATGFFRVEKLGSRWWLIDPLGHPFISMGLTGVEAHQAPSLRPAFDKKYKDDTDWATSENKRLRGWGFNTLGAWSQYQAFQHLDDRLPFTAWPDVVRKPEWRTGLMNGFGEAWKLGAWRDGNHQYLNNCFPVFHPEFAGYCESRAEELKANAGEPRLLGYFLDNELPHPDLARFLALDQAAAGYTETALKAREWWRERKGGPSSEAEMTAGDKDAWAEFAYDAYFKATAGAIRRHDPNHLIFGQRLYGNQKSSPAALRSAGRHLDVISLNFWDAFSPSTSQQGHWNTLSGKPVMITEWSMRGLDGPGNTTPAVSYLAESQKERALYYEHFVLQLLESRVCVGWHWLGYQDMIPQEGRPSDDNIGVVDAGYEPYVPLARGMTEVNRLVYHLADRWT